MKQYKNLDSVIKDLMAEGPLVSLYLFAGIEALKEKIDKMSNEEIVKMFTQLLHPDRVRGNINTIYERLGNWDK
ncbi:MAG: hypothetical protein LBM08_00750 [Dysgonamonadaceae bacterium]|jgi:hypothetical protein|nr:hypothetical protein [Dysgonamonadaceae bacterium]